MLRAQLAQAVRMLAEAQRNSGKPEQAVTHYIESIALCRQGSNPQILAHAIRHLGDIYAEQEWHDQARDCYREALQVYRGCATVPPLDLANALRSASLTERRYDEAAAEKLAAEARTLYASCGIEPKL